jgi:hypothetical protein
MGSCGSADPKPISSQIVDQVLRNVPENFIKERAKPLEHFERFLNCLGLLITDRDKAIIGHRMFLAII